MAEPLETDNDRLQRLLEGKTIRLIRQSGDELMVEFVDGGRLFVDVQDGRMELSVT